MGTFRKSLEIRKKSKQIEENLKKLDEELKKTGSLDNDGSVETAAEDNTPRKIDWRKEFFPEEESINISKGVVLTAPNGSKYRLIVDNSGNLSTVAI